MLLATHDGKFHLDELFAIASLQILYPDLEIVRTRDEEQIKQANIVVDVGGIFDSEKQLFDHHQTGGAGKRENGVPFASFGLVWETYGLQVCEGNERVASLMDKKLVQPIDASDCGYVLYKTTNRTVSPYMFDNVVRALTPTWKDTQPIDQAFFEILPFIKLVLGKEIEKARYFFEDTDAVKQTYKETENKQIIVLEHSYPWKSVISRKKEPVFVTHPDQNTGKWVISCVPKDPKTQEYRKKFPFEWRGKKDDELQIITGVQDAVFCHDKGFICMAGSKEGAVALAQLAIEAYS